MPDATPADRLKAKKPRQITIGVYLDESLADAVDAAAMQLQDGRRLRAEAADIDVLEKRLADAQATLDEGTQWLTFQALGRRAFSRLIEEHPPSAETIALAAQRGQEQEPQFEPLTFAPALIAAACIRPALTVDDVDALYASDAWNEPELSALFAAALAVNTQARPWNVRAGDD